MKVNTDSPPVYTLLNNAVADGAGGYFNAGNAKGLYVHVGSVGGAAAAANVDLQQSIDKNVWVTVLAIITSRALWP